MNISPSSALLLGITLYTSIAVLITGLVAFISSIVLAILSRSRKSLALCWIYPVFLLTVFLYMCLRPGGATGWETAFLMFLFSCGQFFYIRKKVIEENPYCKWSMYCSCMATISPSLAVFIMHTVYFTVSK